MEIVLIILACIFMPLIFITIGLGALLSGIEKFNEAKRQWKS